MNAIVPSNAESYRASTDAASLCRDIVLQTAKQIQNRKYVCVEGWMAIAVAHGCAASARNVERIDGGVRAIGEIRRMGDGVVIAEAEGFVGEDEPTWYGGETISYGKTKTLPKRADYAIRAMAQTRAISRACRSAFAHVVIMIDAGLSTTPAEEVPLGGFNDSNVVEGDYREVANDARGNGLGTKEGNGHSNKAADRQVMTGVHQTKTALKAAVRALMMEVNRAPDIDSFDALIVSEDDLIKQIKADAPDWWDGSAAPDRPGIETQIADRRFTLEREAEINDAGDTTVVNAG